MPKFSDYKVCMVPSLPAVSDGDGHIVPCLFFICDFLFRLRVPSGHNRQSAGGCGRGKL